MSERLDLRALFLTHAMISTTPGVGQAYLGAHRDKEGHAFDGDKSYHLHVPPNPPAKPFWSVTLYDVDTRAIIQNKEQIADRSSRQPELVKNADGSLDLYFGPTAPKGLKKLDFDCGRAGIVCLVPPLWPAARLLRQELAIAGYREGSLMGRMRVLPN